MKKLVGLLAAVLVLPAAIFAQDARVYRYEPFDMLVGVNVGAGMGLGGHIFKPDQTTGNSSPGYEYEAPALGNGYLMGYSDLGLTYDFYIFNWLSANSGLLFHSQWSLIWKEAYNDPDLEIKTEDALQYTAYLTIPLQAHINVPRAEWLYAGLGLNLNIPLYSPLEKTAQFTGLSADDVPKKGPFFVSLPIDVGFDFVKPKEGGARLFLRITPNFIKGHTDENGNEKVPTTFGVIWQIYNFRIDTKSY
jgi:hypothetical protein